jgi:hypothetical protein
MTLMGWATRVLQWRIQKDAMMRVGANLKNSSQFRLFSAIRKHQEGITSNRGSARHGESVPGSCTPRPSHSGNRIGCKSVLYSLFIVKYFEKYFF